MHQPRLSLPCRWIAPIGIQSGIHKPLQNRVLRRFTAIAVASGTGHRTRRIHRISLLQNVTRPAKFTQFRQFTIAKSGIQNDVSFPLQQNSEQISPNDLKHPILPPLATRCSRFIVPSVADQLRMDAADGWGSSPRDGVLSVNDSGWPFSRPEP